MTEYVSGLLFAEDFSLVALIQKNRPVFLDGKLCPIRGHREKTDKSGAHGISRESNEEAGILVPADQWVKYADVLGRGTTPQRPAFQMECFYATVRDVHRARTMTDETIRVLGVMEVLSMSLTQRERIAPDLVALMGLAFAVRDGANPGQLIYP
jgi:hypothetical protein